jgi:Chemotaxis protein CheC, inhibitor of MCP methylation
MDKKYQVFISSTYTDLKEERKEVTRALLEMDCIPTGMEMFQASDDSQWDLIKRVISSCDYYIVIIAGRYGSIHPKTKKSYTQMEYEYASKIGIPIIGFLHENPESLPQIKAEKNKSYQKKLNQFRELAKSKKMIKYWSNPHDLAGSVSRAIYQIIKTHPRKGWIRNEEINTNKNDFSFDILDELNSVKKLVQELQTTNKNIIINNKFEKDITGEIRKEDTKYQQQTTLADNKEDTYSIIFHLNHFQFDALQEIANILLSGGITSFFNLFSRKIKVNPPNLFICQSMNEVKYLIRRDNTFNALSEFNGIIDGKIYLEFYENELNNYCDEILKLHYHSFKYIQNNRIIDSALCEFCSIFTGNSLTRLSKLVDGYDFKITNIQSNIHLQKFDLFQKSHHIFVLSLINNNSYTSICDACLFLNEYTVITLFQYLELI